MMKNRIVENSLNEEKSFPVVLISFFHIWLFSEITSFQNSYSSPPLNIYCCWKIKKCCFLQKMHGGLISLFISMEIKISSFPSKKMCLKKNFSGRTTNLQARCTTPQDNFVSQRPQVMSKICNPTTHYFVRYQKNFRKDICTPTAERYSLVFGGEIS